MKGKDLINHIVRTGGKVKRQSGSHVICQLRNGIEVVVPDHNSHDLGKGLASKLLKILAAAGCAYGALALAMMLIRAM